MGLGAESQIPEQGALRAQVQWDAHHHLVHAGLLKQTAVRRMSRGLGSLSSGLLCCGLLCGGHQQGVAVENALNQKFACVALAVNIVLRNGLDRNLRSFEGPSLDHQTSKASLGIQGVGGGGDGDVGSFLELQHLGHVHGVLRRVGLAAVDGDGGEAAGLLPAGGNLLGALGVAVHFRHRGSDDAVGGDLAAHLIRVADLKGSLRDAASVLRELSLQRFDLGRGGCLLLGENDPLDVLGAGGHGDAAAVRVRLARKGSAEGAGEVDRRGPRLALLVHLVAASR
mmetsp:Transcript_212/g.479  ORF Transcript_212/g.479 Transcript_212/m.479 type:complete len:283 (-) Transcript_212:693-1541(-)